MASSRGEARTGGPGSARGAAGTTAVGPAGCRAGGSAGGPERCRSLPGLPGGLATGAAPRPAGARRAPGPPASGAAQRPPEPEAAGRPARPPLRPLRPRPRAGGRRFRPPLRAARARAAPPRPRGASAAAAGASERVILRGGWPGSLAQAGSSIPGEERVSCDGRSALGSPPRLALSTSEKKLRSSGMSPRRRQVSPPPPEATSSSREAFRSTIQRCSVESSRNGKTAPDSCRSRQSPRSAPSPGGRDLPGGWREVGDGERDVPVAPLQGDRDRQDLLPEQESVAALGAGDLHARLGDPGVVHDILCPAALAADVHGRPSKVAPMHGAAQATDPGGKIDPSPSDDIVGSGAVRAPTPAISPRIHGKAEGQPEVREEPGRGLRKDRHGAGHPGGRPARARNGARHRARHLLGARRPAHHPRCASGLEPGRPGGPPRGAGALPGARILGARPPGGASSSPPSPSSAASRPG